MREIETERLILRFLRMEDADAVYQGWASNPRVTQYLTWKAHTDLSQTRRMLSKWIAFYPFPDFWRWGIERREDLALIGTVGVTNLRQGNPVISYVLGERYWGFGYMTEVLKAVADVLFAHGYHMLIAEAIEGNIASNRVLQKCGFRLVSSRQDLLSAEKPEAVTINSYRLKK